MLLPRYALLQSRFSSFSETRSIPSIPSILPPPSLSLLPSSSERPDVKRQNNVVLPRCITRAGEAREGRIVAADCKSCNANEILQIRFPGGIFR